MQATSPWSSISLNVRWRSIASGVVRCDRVLDSADHALDRAQQPALPSARLEQCSGQERSGGLAVGAGDADDAELRGRVTVEARGGRRHRLSDARHTDLRDAQVQRPLDDEGDRPMGDRVRGVVVAVAAEPGHAEEQRARGYRAVVVREAGDLGVVGVPISAGSGAGNQLVEPHRGPSVVSGSAGILAEATGPRGQLAPLDHAVDQPVGERLLTGEIAIALHVGVNPLDRLSGVLGVDLVDPRP